VLVVERVRAAVESHEYRVRTGHTTRVGISIGAACFPRDGETAEDLLRSAAADMQRDKRSRKPSPFASNREPVASLDAYR
jgi:GGDEF domain-containing protein